MGAGVGREAAALLLAALLGGAAGLLYDLLRPPRRALRRFWAAVIDALYALCVGCGLFFYGMSAGDGRLGLWELTAVLLGFLTWLQLLSPRLLPLLYGISERIARVLERIGKVAKKITESQKNTFIL